MQRFYLQYNTQLCLKSKHTSKCVGIQTSTQVLRADYPPTFIQIKDQLKSQKLQRPNYTLRLKIINRDQQGSKYVIEGSKIHLINATTDQYVICTSQGQIKFDKKSSLAENVNKEMYKASTWTIQFLRNQNKMLLTDKQYVTVYDEICLKSVHNTFLRLKPGSLQLFSVLELDPSKSVWSFIKANVPHIEEWAFTRDPFRKFTKIPLIKQNQNPNQIVKQKKLLKTYPPQKQQVLLVQDLLDIMLGFDGIYIKRSQKRDSFVIQPYLQQPSCTLAFKQLTQKILALPIMYYKIETYINTYSLQEGIMCQAFCGGLKELMKEYQMMVCQYNQESLRNDLSLQKLWYLIQPPMKIMDALAILVTEGQKCRGGQLITLLSKALNQSTDQQISEIYNKLFTDVINVYIQMLSKWLYEGMIQDKYDQFMIKTQQKSVNKEWNYWQEKFMIRQNMVPSIFAKQVNEILVTGKYLNILKSCKKLGQNPHKKQIYLHLTRFISLQNFSQPILRAYQWTNKQMLDLVFNDYKFQDVLKSIKGYFFLEYGDLFVHLLDAAQDDLSTLKNKKMNEIPIHAKFKKQKPKAFSQQKIQNLFQSLIRTSSANNDPFKQQVTCRIQNITIYEQMHRLKTLQLQQLKFNVGQKAFVKKDSKYIDYLTLEYKCQFPLTLIFNKKSMSKYQVLFRFLIWAKFIQRKLNNVWFTLQSTKKAFLPFYTPAYMLNQRMIGFIKNFIYYICYQVIEQHWLELNQNLKKVKDFEDIIKYHTEFLNKCLIESLLANNKLLGIITSEVGVACQSLIKIRDLIQEVYQRTGFQEEVHFDPQLGSVVDQRKQYMKEMKYKIEQQLNEEELTDLIQKCGDDFDDSMRKLLNQIYAMIGKQNFLANLLDRLDGENFYNRRLRENNVMEITN